MEERFNGVSRVFQRCSGIFEGVSIVFMTLMMFQGFSVFGKFVVSLHLPGQDLFLCVAGGMNITHYFLEKQ